jgi:hypothetical protein
VDTPGAKQATQPQPGSTAASVQLPGEGPRPAGQAQLGPGWQKLPSLAQWRELYHIWLSPEGTGAYQMLHTGLNSLALEELALLSTY